MIEWYQERSPKVEALKFNPYCEQQLDFLTNWYTKLKHVEPVGAYILTGVPRQPMVFKGDYIVRGAKDEIYVMDRHEFEQKYKKVESIHTWY